MTKPSKAQIDRAAVHLMHLFTERGGPTYEEMAECALTAAAQVGDTELERLRIEVANLRKEKTPRYELLAGEIGRLEEGIERLRAALMEIRAFSEDSVEGQIAKKALTENRALKEKL